MIKKAIFSILTLGLLVGIAGTPSASNQVVAATTEPSITGGAIVSNPITNNPITIEIEDNLQLPQNRQLEDNDELFSGYVDQELGVSLFSDAAVLDDDKGMGSIKLTGNALTLYQKLKKQIVRIANGQQSSTIVKMSMSDMPVSFTLQEMGYYRLTEEAKNQIGNVICDKLKLYDVIKYLLMDCPYNLYWYNKVSNDSPIYYQAKVIGTTVYASEITICFTPVPEYADRQSFTVDTAKTSATKNAVAKAKSIVSAVAGKSDYEKLQYYKNEICKLTSYNYDALEDDYPYEYGNPWQLIYVFDENPNTNVVCEGYAKAFQYLCELSDFTDDINSILVMGDVYSADEAFPHMWNVVNMKDGKNYIVDVTNCDAGMIGATDRLFLAGAAGDVTNGYRFRFDTRNIIRYTYYNDILKLYGPSLLQLATQNYDDSAEAVCTHLRSKITNYQAAKCFENGYSGDKVCKKCNQILASGHTIPAIGKHVWNHGFVNCPATYTSEGSQTFTCLRCFATRTEIIPMLKKVSKITINGISKQIAAGKKVKLSADIFPEDAANKNLVWKSSNTKVATVSSKGVVTVKAKTGGKSVTITATATDGSGIKAIYVICSMKSAVIKITGKDPKSPLAVGKTLKLRAKVIAKSGANKKLEWKSKNTRYATVVNGKVTALAAGKGKTVSIIAKATDGSGKKKVFKVKIK